MIGIPRRAPLWQLPSWTAPFRRASHIRLSSPTKNKGARMGVVAAALTYTILLSLVTLITPRAVNFDLFYLLGCVLTGWVAGELAGLWIALVSGIFLFVHHAFVGGIGVPLWILYWNSIVRL